MASNHRQKSVSGYFLRQTGAEQTQSPIETNTSGQSASHATLTPAMHNNSSHNSHWIWSFLAGSYCRQRTRLLTIRHQRRQRQQNQSHHLHHCHSNPYQYHKYNHQHPTDKSVLASILLPLLCLFLLPSLKLVERQDSASTAENQAAVLHTNYGAGPLPMASELLVALVRLPFDRLRLVSGLTITGAEAKDTMSRQDLQEEETHMQLQGPSEHRGYPYLGGGGPRPPPHRVAELASGGGYMPASDSLHVAPGQSHQVGGGESAAPSEYGIASADQVEGGGSMGTVEGTSVAEAGSHVSSGGGGSGLQTRGDLPSVRALNVKCEKNHMTVNIVFDRPFYGMVFSKGHYNDQKCVHLPANSGSTSVNFDIHLGKCGMSSSDASGNPNALQVQQQLAAASGGQQQPNGLYIENTIIIQYDPQVQEIYDQARKLRCTWYDYYEKSVTFRPYNVDMLDAVTANFLGDNIQCWMQIQVGKGPWSSEVAGIVKIGQTMTMVLAIKDDENRFDMLVRNCVAHDGKHQPIQLVDEYGCVARPKIMAKFQKVRNFGSSATVVSYAHFQAFKFPDSMSVHFQCVIQVCRYECPEPVCGSNSGSSGAQSAGELGAAGQSGTATGDYTASGTEIVASKEPLPGISPGTYFMANNSMAASGGSHGAAAVNLRLDESQGRVQVKLDTSMMAGGRARVAVASGPGGGPLQPHLLHASSEGPAPVPPGYVSASRPQQHLNPSASYYRPVIGDGGSATGGLGPTANGQRSTNGQHLPPIQGGATTLNGRPPMLNVRAQMAPPAHRSAQQHFSSPYAQNQQQSLLTHRIYATNRLGELPELAEDHKHPIATGLEQSSELGPQQATPLSLLAVPRGLRTSLRQRRSIDELTPNGHRPPLDGVAPQHRSARHSTGPEESTAIKTQKTIQVVSPDDVAFSLADESELPLLMAGGGGNQRRPLPIMEPINTVCFSATRLIVAVLVTLAALVAGLVIVAYLIMRQRANKNGAKLVDHYQYPDKLSSIYDDSDTQAALGCASSLHQHYESSHHQLPVNAVRQVGGAYGDADTATASMISIQQRQQQQQQQEEIRQRNNYLARLYSQFVPANYWR